MLSLSLKLLRVQVRGITHLLRLIKVAYYLKAISDLLHDLSVTFTVPNLNESYFLQSLAENGYYPEGSTGS